MHEHPDFNYSYITDGISIGNNACCAMHFSEILAKKEGIVADISLEEDKLDHPFGVEAYLWLPTPDHTAPTPDQLTLGVQSLETLVLQEKKVFVHCKNGHGRAPTLVAAYLVHRGMTVSDAEALIKKQRPGIHLQDAQRQALEAYAARLAV